MRIEFVSNYVTSAHHIYAKIGAIIKENMTDYWQAGTSGFGIGSNLYAPGLKVEEIFHWNKELVAGMNRIQGSQLI